VKRKNESELASKQASVTNAERQLAVREQRVEELEEQVVNTRILAPTSGLVVYATSLERGWRGNDDPLDVGSEISPNEEIIHLPNSEQMIASIKVHESLIGRIDAGQPSSVRIDAIRGESFKGTVDSVGVVAESGGWRDPNLREYTVKVVIDGDNANRDLKPSMRADAEIRLGRVEDVLTVPVQAVFRAGEVAYVYEKQGDRYVRTPVRIGRRSTTEAEVVAGLEGGERVLLREPRPGEVIDRPFSPEALAAVARPESEQQQGEPRMVAAGDRQRPQGQRRAGFDIQGWLRANAGKNIDDLELPEQMKDRLRQQYPDGKIPDDAGQDGSTPSGPSSAAATPSPSSAE